MQKMERKITQDVLTDSEIIIAEYNSLKKHPESLWLAKFHNDEQDRDFAFLTNAIDLSSLEVANLYKIWRQF